MHALCIPHKLEESKVSFLKTVDYISKVSVLFLFYDCQVYFPLMTLISNTVPLNIFFCLVPSSDTYLEISVYKTLLLFSSF